MNEQNLREVVDGVEEQLSTYAPGGSTQLLAPRPLRAKAQAIVDDARKLCDDTLEAYQQQVDVATAKRDAAKTFCDRMMAAATKTAAELEEDAARQTTLIEEMDAAITKYERARSESEKQN